MVTTRSKGGAGNAAERLNSTIDCADLAVRLGMEQPGGKGSNFKSPHHRDKAPSVSVYAAKSGKGSRFHDFSTGESGGPIDMLMWHSGMEFVPALKELAEMYGVTLERPGSEPQARAEQTLAEFIADKCLQAVRNPDGAADVLNYLEGRGIGRAVIEHALAKGTLGLNTYRNPKAAEGEIGHGGPAVAFIVRAQHTGAVVAVDMRYLDAATNGGVKSQSQGEKALWPWCSDWKRLALARTVYVVESSINALSIESCRMPGTAALAVRGTGNVETIDWSFLRGKQVIACFDNDKPQERGPDAGYCAGLKAAWRLHELLTGLDISCVLVDQSDWWADEEKKVPINDINDWLQERGADMTEAALKKLENWMIPGMVGDDKRLGKPRIWLPQHDYHVYWKYRTQLDFTRAISKVTKSEEEGAPDKLEFSDVCSFRIAAISRVQIASAISMMTGDEDHAPTTVFALSVQTARHGSTLLRRVVEDERLHNVDVWKRIGQIFAPAQFGRMVNIWERAVSIGAREAINFVGVAWRDGRTVVNEGPDCFFADPRQQCPYHSLTFPRGPISDAREVMAQFQGTFRGNAASIILVWALGAHLKAFLGFWPHFVMQAEKSTGKTTVVKRMERAIAMTMFSRQTIETAFRRLTSISSTSHPVGWEEISAGKQDTINNAVANLQESYMYTYTQRGTEMKAFLLCAPVLLAGEDVPVKSLQGKVVRTELTLAMRGPVIPEDMPVFPVRQWLQFVAGQRKERVAALHAELVELMTEKCIAKREDAGADRMVANYAALGTAWHLLCEFADVPIEQGSFIGDLTAVMNKHIVESESDRQPWAWIVDKLLSEIATGAFRYPFKFDEEDEVPVLCVRTGHVMDHISQQPQLREFWDGLPVKTAQVFKKQLMAAGVLATDLNGAAVDVERTVKGQRVSHMVCLSLPMLGQYGLHAVVPKVTDEFGGRFAPPEGY